MVLWGCPGLAGKKQHPRGRRGRERPLCTSETAHPKGHPQAPLPFPFAFSRSRGRRSGQGLREVPPWPHGSCNHRAGLHQGPHLPI